MEDFSDPGPPTVRHDDRKLRKIGEDAVGAHRIGIAQVRTCGSTDHHDHRDLQVLAMSVDRIEAPIVGIHRHRIGARLDVDELEAALDGRGNRLAGPDARRGIDRRRTDESLGKLRDDLPHIVVGHAAEHARETADHHALVDVDPSISFSNRSIEALRRGRGLEPTVCVNPSLRSPAEYIKVFRILPSGGRRRKSMIIECSLDSIDSRRRGGHRSPVYITSSLRLSVSP